MSRKYMENCIKTHTKLPLRKWYINRDNVSTMGGKGSESTSNLM